MQGQDSAFLTKKRLEGILDGIGSVRVGVLGDFCMDIYWHADMTRSVLSRETPHFPLPIVEERMSPGAAGNVAANIAALKPASLIALGTIGSDWRGDLLENDLNALGADVRFIKSADRMTNAYIKPMMKGISDVVYEAPRLDFENIKPLSAQAEDELLQQIRNAAKDIDVLCVCDQMKNGCVSERVRSLVAELAKDGLIVIADSRENIALFKNAVIKPNDIEAARALGEANISAKEAAARLHRHTGNTVVVTAGPDGCWLCDGDEPLHCPARPVQPPVDICGAGDTFLSTFACALGAGANAAEAAVMGNLASSVTIKKLAVTGTASREELLAAL